MAYHPNVRLLRPVPLVNLSYLRFRSLRLDLGDFYLYLVGASKLSLFLNDHEVETPHSKTAS